MIPLLYNSLKVTIKISYKVNYGAQFYDEDNWFPPVLTCIIPQVLKVPFLLIMLSAAMLSVCMCVRVCENGGVKDAAGSPRYEKLGHVIQRNEGFLCTMYCSNLCKISGSLSPQTWVFYLKTISPLLHMPKTNQSLNLFLA